MTKCFWYGSRGKLSEFDKISLLLYLLHFCWYLYPDFSLMKLLYFLNDMILVTLFVVEIATHIFFLISNTILPILTLEILSVAKQKSKKRRLKRSLSLSFNWVEKLSGLDSEIELLIKKFCSPSRKFIESFGILCKYYSLTIFPLRTIQGGYLQDKILTFMKLSDMVSWHLNSAQF